MGTFGSKFWGSSESALNWKKMQPGGMICGRQGWLECGTPVQTNGMLLGVLNQLHK